MRRTHVLPRPIVSLLALTLIVLCGALASTAPAAVPGLEQVSQVDLNDSSSHHFALARCPGKRVLGGGGEIIGGFGQASMSGIVPVGETNGVSADEDDTGTAANWTVRAYAICANPLPGLELINANSALDSQPVKSATARCPSGKMMVGAGHAIVGNGIVESDVRLDDIIPNAPLTPANAPPTSVTVQAIEDETGTPLSWMVRARAVCAFPPPGLELRTERSFFPSDSSSPKQTLARCSPGKKVLGAGGSITNGNGQVVIDDIIPNAPGTPPNAPATSVTVTGYEDETGYPNNWFVRAYAICANP